MSQRSSQPPEGFPPSHTFQFNPQLSLPPDIRSRTPAFQHMSLDRPSLPNDFARAQDQERILHDVSINTAGYAHRASYQAPPPFQSLSPDVDGENPDGHRHPETNPYSVPVGRTLSGSSAQSGSLNASGSASSFPVPSPGVASGSSSRSVSVNISGSGRDISAPPRPPSERPHAFLGAAGEHAACDDSPQVNYLKAYANWAVSALDLQPVQLGDLHRYADHQLGANIDIGQAQINIWTLGRIFQTMNALERQQANSDRVDKLVRTLIERLERDFKLTQDQINYIIKLCKDAVFGYTVWNYRTSGAMVEEVEGKLRAHELFQNIYKSDDKTIEQKAVTESVKDKLSNARTELRSEVIDSICQRINLHTLTYNLAKKFKKGGLSSSTKLSYKYQIQVALIRRFTWDEMRTSVFNVPQNNDWDAPLTRKKQGAGKTAQGEDFFSKLDKWLANHIKTFGDDRSSDDWKAYILETLNWDHQTFKGGDVESSQMEALPKTLVSAPNNGNAGPQQHVGGINAGGVGVASGGGVQATSGSSTGSSLFSGSLDNMPTFNY